MIGFKALSPLTITPHASACAICGAKTHELEHVKVTPPAALKGMVPPVMHLLACLGCRYWINHSRDVDQQVMHATVQHYAIKN